MVIHLLNIKFVGRFFGEIDGMVMEMLVNSDVYKRVRIVDHQAVCFQPVNKASCGVKVTLNLPPNQFLITS